MKRRSGKGLGGRKAANPKTRMLSIGVGVMLVLGVAAFFQSSNSDRVFAQQIYLVWHDREIL